MTYKPHHLLTAVLVLSTLSSGGAKAANVTGQQLLSLCTANMGGNGNALEAAECMGFIVGVADTFDCIDATLLFNRANSAKISQPQLVQHVVNYIENHPTAKGREAFSVVGLALAAHFPCQPTAMIRGIEAPHAN